MSTAGIEKELSMKKKPHTQERRNQQLGQQNSDAVLSRSTTTSLSMQASHSNKAAGIDLKKVGPRPNVIQIVPPVQMVRPSAALFEDQNRDLINRPIEAPTGPQGAKGFRNRAGSQIPVPHVMNVYMGPFWDDMEKL